MATRAGQKLSKHFLLISEDFTKSIGEKFHAEGSYQTVLPFKFVDMDKTEVFFEPKLKPAIHCKEDNTVFIRYSGSNNRRATVCVLTSSDGKKSVVSNFFQTTAILND